MKAISIVVLLLLIILVLVMLGVWYISDSAQQVILRLSNLDQLFVTEQWETARLQYNDSFSCWKKQQKNWQILINHDDMRDIEISFIDLSTAIDQQDSVEAQRELAELRFFLNHVPDTERVEWGNVF